MTAPGHPLRVGLVGFGYAGATIHAPLLASTPGLDLCAVASSKPAAVAAALGPQVQVLADPAALVALPGLDLVVIASPNDTHVPLARAALQAGRHVVVDKPFALQAADAEPLLALAEAGGRVLSVFHNRRWDADMLTARALLASGTLGRLTTAWLHFDRFRPQVRARWREGNGPGAGLYMDLAPHLLDQALVLFGPPLAISADIGCLRDGGLSDDHFVLRLRHADGLRVTLSASMLAALPGPRFALHGSRGSWVKHGLDTQEEALKAGRRPDPAHAGAWGADPQAGELCVLPEVAASGAAAGAEPQARRWPNLPGRWPDYYAGIRDAILGRAPNPVPAAEALAVLRWMDLGRTAAVSRSERTLTG